MTYKGTSKAISILNIIDTRYKRSKDKKKLYAPESMITGHKNTGVHDFRLWYKGSSIQSSIISHANALPPGKKWLHRSIPYSLKILTKNQQQQQQK